MREVSSEINVYPSLLHQKSQGAMIKFRLSLTFRNVNVILVRTLAALESMQINIWHQNDSICEKCEKILFELFDPKNYIILIGVTPNGKIFFFRF